MSKHIVFETNHPLITGNVKLDLAFELARLADDQLEENDVGTYEVSITYNGREFLFETMDKIHFSLIGFAEY